MRIDKFVYDPGRNISEVAISVVTGAFRFISGNATWANPRQPAVRTPVGEIGIRGTIFEGVIGADALNIAGKEEIGRSIGQADATVATLVILRGPGPAVQGSEHPGAIDVSSNDVTVALTSPGTAVLIPAAGQAPIGPFRISKPGLLAIQALLSGMPTSGTIGPDTIPTLNPALDVELPYSIPSQLAP
jgi:hypothetical protein